MSGFGGSYTVIPGVPGSGLFTTFERERIVSMLMQQGVPISDIDQNLRSSIALALNRRIAQNFLGDGAFGDGWKPVGSGASNNFTLKGGSGTPDSALSFLLKGFRVSLFSDISFDNLGASYEEASIHSKSSGLSSTVLTDLSANYKVNELAGRLLRPKISSGTTFIIASNTATTITVTAGDMTAIAVAGDRYLVQPSTPGSNRTDHVWMRIGVQERFDPATDKRLIETDLTECERLLEIFIHIHVREGDSDPMVDYVDGFGNQNYLVKLGTIARFTGQAAINALDVTDTRNVLPSLEGLRKAGLFVGSPDNWVTSSPNYASEKFILDGDSIKAAVEKIDTALSREHIVAIGHSRYADMTAFLADSGIPGGSVILINNASEAGVLNVRAIHVTGSYLVLARSFLSLNQNGGKISEIVGIAGSKLRSLLVDGAIKISDVLFEDSDSLAPYGIRLTGASNFDLTLVRVRLKRELSSDLAINLDESAFTGSVRFLFEDCVFEGSITSARLLQTMSLASFNYPHTFKNCIFEGSLSLTALASTSILAEDSRFLHYGYHTNEVVVANGGAPSVGPFAGILAFTPVNPGKLKLTMTKDGGGTLKAWDNGNGVLVGSDVSSGTINYTTGAVSVTWTSNAAASVNLLATYQDRITTLPTLSNVTIHLKNCFVGDTFVSTGKLDNTGLHSAASRLAQVTTTQRDALIFKNEGLALLNTTRKTPQMRGNGRWLDMMARLEYKFHYYQVAASLSNQLMYHESGLFEIIVPWKSLIVALTLQSSLARTAGTLTAKPSIAGVAVGTTVLDTVIDGTNPTGNYTKVVPGSDSNLLVNAGQKVGVMITTDGSWLPITADISAFLYLVTEDE